MGRAKQNTSNYKSLVAVILTSNLLSVALFLARAIEGQSWRFWFLLWNLVLAWVPLLVVLALILRLKSSRWLSPVNIALTVLWLGFLPNSFYLLSDLIHLQNTPETGLLYDSVMFSSFIFNAYLAGFMSLYFMHREFIKRLRLRYAHGIIGVILLLCGYAIHLGRSLRWNTWDVLINPAGILFDVSEQFVNPVAQSPAVVTTLTFFALLASMYAVLLHLAGVLKRD
jgi:uncharacterized membrane protein